MTTNNTWLLPEGISELLPEQAQAMEQLRRQILDLYASWGYDLVATPFVEHLDSLLTGTGKDLELQTFKITDQMSGRQLGIRADTTPQVARIDAHKMQKTGPNRLCYNGTVLRTRPDGFSGSRNPSQIGAELYGHAGVESDVEIVCLMMETLRAAGLDEIYLDLGHVGIFRGLAREAGLSEQQESQMFEALQRKSVPEIESLVAGLDVSDEMAAMLKSLPVLNGGAVVFEQARAALAAAPADVKEALDYVEAVAQHLNYCQPGVPVHVDLAELRAYHYQTGVAFAAFIPGRGNEVARGGRYDHIGEVFGRARPATGFSADLKALLDAGGFALEEQEGAVLAPWSEDEDLAEKVKALRDAGRRVIRELPGQTGDIAELGCTHKLEKNASGWELLPL